MKKLIIVLWLFTTIFTTSVFAWYPNDYIDYFDFEDSLVSNVQWYWPNNSITHSFVDWDSWRAINIPNVWGRLLYEPFRQPWSKASMTVCWDYLADWSLDWVPRTAFTQYRNFRSIWVANNRFGANWAYTTSFTSDNLRHTVCIVADNDDTSNRQYRVYLDWSLANSTAYNENWYVTSERRLFNGIAWTYDNLFFYDRTLTSTEISWIWWWINTDPACWAAHEQVYTWSVQEATQPNRIPDTLCENSIHSDFIYYYWDTRTRTCWDNNSSENDVQCYANEIEVWEWVCNLDYHWKEILVSQRDDINSEWWSLWEEDLCSSWNPVNLSTNWTWDSQYYTRECFWENSWDISNSCWAVTVIDPQSLIWWLINWFTDTTNQAINNIINQSWRFDTVTSTIKPFFNFWFIANWNLEFWFPSIDNNWDTSVQMITTNMNSFSDRYTKTCTDTECTVTTPSWTTHTHKLSWYRNFLNHFVPVFAGILFVMFQITLIYLFLRLPFLFLYNMTKSYVSNINVEKWSGSIASWIAKNIHLIWTFWVATVITWLYTQFYSSIHVWAKYFFGNLLDFLVNWLFQFNSIDMFTVSSTISGSFFILLWSYAVYTVVHNYARPL